jgi:NAD(P)-dependent dehydrogenase (short-subunit alcohol dehydrogenase family)
MQNKKAIVVGGSRGLGRGAVEELARQGFAVSVVGRDAAALAALAAEVPGATGVLGDATDEALAERTLASGPDLVVVCAGAPPVLKPLHQQTWEEFETNWRADTRIAFGWLRQALRRPLAPGSQVIIVSSGAAMQGSPASGGYASAKRAQWFIADYAANESTRAGLGIRVQCVLPNLNPSTELGRHGIAAYAQRAGLSEEAFARRFAPHLTPAIFGAAIAELATHPEKWEHLAYRVTGAGLVALS